MKHHYSKEKVLKKNNSLAQLKGIPNINLQSELGFAKLKKNNQKNKGILSIYIRFNPMNAEFNKFYSELGENNFRNVLLPESMAVKQSIENYGIFSLYMADDSMSGIIELGDRVIVNARKPLNIGDIVLFFYHDELLIRRLISNDSKANNQKYADIPVKNVEYFLGKVTARITDFEN